MSGLWMLLYQIILGLRKSKWKKLQTTGTCWSNLNIFEKEICCYTNMTGALEATPKELFYLKILICWTEHPNFTKKTYPVCNYLHSQILP